MEESKTSPASTGIKIQFQSGGLTCASRLYWPDSAHKAIPCIVMANGFSGTMDWILPAFASKFVAGGFAVLLFDYRFLGESEGQPRQIININKQIEDVKNAMALARNYKGIDPKKIVLWGTSLGGSHILKIAAMDRDIAALIANIPALDVVKGANIEMKLKKMNVSRWQMLVTSIQLLGAAILDVFKSLLGLPPHYIEVYGKPGKAFFTDPDLTNNFKRVSAGSRTWKNAIAPRFLFNVPRYKEGTMEAIKVPVLFTIAQKDLEVSARYIKEIAGKSALAEVKEYPAEHFEMYHGALSEQLVEDQLDFLMRIFTKV